jgi:hypothetical protein
VEKFTDTKFCELLYYVGYVKPPPWGGDFSYVLEFAILMYGVSPNEGYTGYKGYYMPSPLSTDSNSYSMPLLALILLNPAITFLAQWHPLIHPKMTTFRGSADWSGAS